MNQAPSLTRDQLGALQNLSVRLLFCHRTLNDYRDDPARVLRAAGLPDAAARLLPDAKSENFLAESHGRRILVVRTVSDNYPRTAEFFERLKAAPRSGLAPLRFDDFLSSDAFLEPGRSLPHPAGVGPGYESISKFFFWMRDRYRSRDDDADAELRGALNADFAVYLIQTLNGPHHPYYDRFKGGVRWREAPGRETPVILVAESLMAMRIGDPAKAAELARIGIVDLDALEPEPGELEPAI